MTLLTTLQRPAGTRKVEWYIDRLEFYSLNRGNELRKVDTLYFPKPDGVNVEWRKGLGKYYMELSDLWLDKAQLPPEPR